MNCIFCKKNSDDSVSVEHIIPESLGSKKVVLPKGFVCDKCNNYFSIKVESPILSHSSFQNIRAWYQVPNKKRKMPKVKGIIVGEDIDISMKLGKNGKLDIQPAKENERNKFNKELESFNNPIVFKLDINPPKKEMSRFLAKMGLEFLVFRFKNDKNMIDLITHSEHYDLIRNFARIGNNIKNWPYNIRRIFPIETKMEYPDKDNLVMFGFGYDLLLNQRKETYFIFLFYGVEFVINLGGPSIKGYEEWLEINNNISPIIERNGAIIEQEKHGAELINVIRGEMDLNKGKAFDKKLIDKYFA